MSNGVIAIRGFEYQATVILDRLFDHFDRNGPTARVRPEGDDDLDLYWTENGVERRHYLQIKKPRENDEAIASLIVPSLRTLNFKLPSILGSCCNPMKPNDH